MRKVLLGGVVTAIAAALAACSNDPAQPDTGEVSFALDGDGQQVFMNGSPRDPAYKAAYPLTGVDRLVVTVKQSGRLAAQCTRNGVSKTCDDTPFFAKISRTGASCSGVRTRVFDLKGTLIADVKYAHYVGDDGTTHDYDPNGGSSHDGEPGGTHDGTSTSGGTVDGTGGGGTSSGGVGGSSGGTSSGGTSSGGTADGGGCTTLGGCCATLTGGLKTGCAQMVGIGDGSACASLLGAYQSLGYCGGTHDGGGSSGGGGGSSGWPGSSGGGTSSGTSGASSGGAGGGAGGGDDGCGGGTGDGSGGGGASSGGTSGSSGASSGGASSGGVSSGGASSGGTSGSSGASSGGASGSSGGGTSDCSQTDFAQARAQFCAGVNQWLKAHNLNITIDCGQLDSTSFDVGAMYSQSAADYSCTDILEDSWWKAHDLLVWTDKCGASAETTLYNWKEEARYQLKKDGACRHSPLVLDLDGDGIALTPLDRGVSFDLLATGTKVKSAWIGAGDALLAIDWNGNGAIDGARELFGQSSFGHRYEDGFAALRELDRNGDGVVDAKDPAWGELLAWRDADKDGVSKPSELVPLADLGVTLLVVTPERTTGGFDAHGNQIPLVSKFVREDGTRAALVDAFFRFQP